MTTDEAFDIAYDAIQARVLARVGPRCLVSYSAYETTEDEVPIDNLDAIPIRGAVRVRGDRTEYFGGPKSRDYEGPVLESPTWLDLCVIAHAQIRRTRDHHHRYLESIEVEGVEGGVQVARFFLGS